jgi:hypothetical protein
MKQNQDMGTAVISALAAPNGETIMKQWTERESDLHKLARLRGWHMQRAVVYTVPCHPDAAPGSCASKDFTSTRGFELWKGRREKPGNPIYAFGDLDGVAKFLGNAKAWGNVRFSIE